MQAQGTRTTQAITPAQSLAAVQTLLQAGLGCIAFLRNLLPDDNFSESYFTTMDSGPTSTPASDASFSSVDMDKKRNVNSFKIMTITRGYTSEADRIMDYLEHGIFDALSKQYLRSFIFAIYLDNKDPTNIVEAYTFNFQYHTVPGTKYAVPVMTLGDNLRKVSLNGLDRDPVMEAAKQGRPPTLKDVKKSVKSLLKALIHATSQMDLLPKKRFATFKLFYMDHTPSDYEPPHFQAGDAEKDKWFFMTHDLDEVPDKWSIGRVMTGHHSVGLSVASIAAYLPSLTNSDNAIFAGITPNPATSHVVTSTTQHVERQVEDAKARNVVWAADAAVLGDDIDAEGDDDPDYVQAEDDTQARAPVPIGIRSGDGSLEPIDSLPVEKQFGGISEAVPTKLQDMNKRSKELPNIEETQSIPSQTSTARPPYTAHPKGSDVTMREQSLPPSDFGDSIQSIQSSELAAAMLENLKIQAETEHDNMLMLEGAPNDLPADRTNFTPPLASNSNLVDNGLDCECGVADEDQCCFCEGGCQRWFHVWCMGYHSIKDRRMPAKFVCFDCRLHADRNWELLKGELYPKMMNKFKELALFRRSIKIAETDNPSTPAEFAKAIGGDHALARQLCKRLEKEGFILQETVVVGDFGLTETYVRGKGRGGGKTKKRRNLQKAKYIFNRSIKRSVEYANYFNPDHEVEARMLGLPDLIKKPATCQGVQNEISNVAGIGVHYKRDLQPSSGERPTKKIKISLTAGVDLAE